MSVTDSGSNTGINATPYTAVETTVASDAGQSTGATATPATAGETTTATVDNPTTTPYGETGRVEITGAYGDGVTASVSFQQSYTEPVVVAFLGTYANPVPLSARVRDITADGCTLYLERPAMTGLGTTAAAETVSFAVFEAGVHETSAGRRIEARTHTTAAVQGSSQPDIASWDTLTFTAPFSTAPVVLSSLATRTADIWRGTVHSNLNATTVQIAQEAVQTPYDGGTETIGVVAIEPGIDQFDSDDFAAGFTGDVVTGPDNTGSPKATGFGHTFGAAPDLLSHSQTRDGGDGVIPRGAGWTTTEFSAYADEDQVADSERAHTTENFGFFAITAGATAAGQGTISAATASPQPTPTTYTATESPAPTRAHADPIDSNILLNPSFEHDTPGTRDPTGWEYPAGDSYVVTESYAVDGAQTFGNTHSGAEYGGASAGTYPQTYIYQDVPLAGQQIVEVSASFVLESASLGGYTGDRTAEGLEYIFEDDARIHLKAYDDTGTLLDEYTALWTGEYAGQNGLTGGSFIRYDRTATWWTPPETATLRVQFDYGDGNNGYRDPETGGSGHAGVYTDNAVAVSDTSPIESVVHTSRPTDATATTTATTDTGLVSESGGLTQVTVAPYKEDLRRTAEDTTYLGDGYLGDSYIGSGETRAALAEDEKPQPSEYPVSKYQDLVDSLAPQGPDRPRLRLNENMKSPPFPVSEAPPSDTDQFSNWDGYLTTFAGEFEELEYAREETTLARYVETAQRGALDNIGDFVNTPRERGEEDPHYRARLKLKLRVSIGGGTIADVREAAAAILDTTPDRIGVGEDSRDEPARFRMLLDRQDIDDAGVPFEDFVDIITDVKAAGVRVFGVYVGAFTHRSETDFKNGINSPDLAYAESYTTNADGTVDERIGGGKYASLAWTPEERVIL